MRLSAHNLKLLASGGNNLQPVGKEKGRKKGQKSQIASRGEALPGGEARTSPNRGVRLHSIDVELEAGSLVLLIGQTGSGKSSLLECLAGLLPPAEGTIYVGQRPLWQAGKRDRAAAASLGMVFQRPEEQLFARTVRDEFAYSLKPLRLPREEASARMASALKAVGLSEAVLPESPLLLSGGQKRRAALASTFACRPQWLLLDEPTAGLDGESTQSVADYLIQWKQHSSSGIVLATHDLDTFLPLADRVLLMEHGTIAADVSGAELLERPELLAARGLEPPAFMRAKLLLAELGLAVPPGMLAPEQAAAALAAIAQPVAAREAAGAAGKPAPGRVAEAAAPVSEAAVAQPAMASEAAAAGKPATAEPVPAREAEDAAGGALRARDPRALWLVYMMLSFGIFMQNSLQGLIASTVIVAIAVTISGVGWQAVRSLIKALIFLIVASAIVSGLQLSFTGSWRPEIGFSIDRAVITTIQLAKLGCAMVLGIIFPLAVGYLRMKQALKQSLGFMQRWGVPVEALALSVSLIFRFITLLFQEWHRFSRIARARAQSDAKPGTIKAKEIPAVVIPFLLSLLHLAEQTSQALEMRGYTTAGKQRTSSIHLQMQTADYYWIIGGCLLLVLMLGMRLF